jgi:hypothetical protein
MRPMRFADAAMGGTPARYLDLFPALPDAVIAELVGAYRRPESSIAAVEIRHWGGAMAAAGPDAGPVGHRGVPFSVIVDGAEPTLAGTLRPYAIGGSFLNFLADPGRTATAYRPGDYRRLQQVKAAYDPDNLFRVNHNIPPVPVTGRIATANLG